MAASLSFDPRSPVCRQSLGPKSVDYRLLTGFGDRCAKVDLSGTEPRFSAWTERIGPNGLEVGPLSLTLTEIQVLLQDARARHGV
jgi:hypothetical protein